MLTTDVIYEHILIAYENSFTTQPIKYSIFQRKLRPHPWRHSSCPGAMPRPRPSTVVPEFSLLWQKQLSSPAPNLLDGTYLIFRSRYTNLQVLKITGCAWNHPKYGSCRSRPRLLDLVALLSHPTVVVILLLYLASLQWGISRIGEKVQGVIIVIGPFRKFEHTAPVVS